MDEVIRKDLIMKLIEMISALIVGTQLVASTSFATNYDCLSVASQTDSSGLLMQVAVERQAGKNANLLLISLDRNFSLASAYPEQRYIISSSADDQNRLLAGIPDPDDFNYFTHSMEVDSSLLQGSLNGNITINTAHGGGWVATVFVCNRK